MMKERGMWSNDQSHISPSKLCLKDICLIGQVRGALLTDRKNLLRRNFDIVGRCILSIGVPGGTVAPKVP